MQFREQGAAAAVPAVDEVGHRVVDTEGRCIQVSADLDIVASHEADSRLVLIVKDLPLQGGAEQQHEVVCRRRRMVRRVFLCVKPQLNLHNKNTIVPFNL